MADDNRIEIVASLNYKVSEASIIGDLEKIQDTFNNAGGLKIGCTINSDSLKTIQTQISNIASNLNINVGAITAQSIMSDDTARHIEQNAQAVQSSLNGIVNTVQNVQNRSNVRMNLQINTEAIDRFINRLNTLGVQGVNIDELRERLQKLDVSIDKITPTFTRLRNGAEVLSTISIKGKDSLGQLIDYTERYRSQVSKTSNQVTTTFNNATTKVTQNFEKIRAAQEKVRKETETKQTALNKFLSLQGKYNVIQSKYGENTELASRLQTIKQLVDSFNNSAPIEKQQESLIRIDNELKLIAVDIEKIQSKGTLIKSDLYPDISKVAAVGTDNSAQLESAKNQLNEYFKNVAQVEDSATRIKRAVSDTTGELTKFYVQVEKEDKSVETLTYALNKQGTAYEFVSKAIREADNSTDFRRKGLDTQIEIQTQKVEQFAETVGKSQEATAILDKDIAKLREDIGKVGDTNAMNTFLDNFDIAKAKFGAISAQLQNTKRDYDSVNKSINDNIKSLEKFNNSTIAKNNASNPTVVSQTGLNADLINQLRGLQESLANDKSPENIARITARMNELGSSLRDAKFNSEALDQSLRDESSAAKLNANISKLTNQMDIFANTNRKATESLRLMRDGETTFAAKWQELTAAIHSGNLSAEDLRRLSDEFRVFRGEADAAGLTVSRFFQSMQSQLRMVLQRWISLYAVIGYIRKMIDNVKELDNAMINLRRVTNETDAGYQRFLEDANKLARQMKTTTASLVEMSYQWSKLGYEMNEALELSKASTIFMRVADVGQDQALSNLVTSLKAFRLEASQTMDVVDKLDKLNNEYAVSASGLGQGLERSASAMAMTGNSLEETLAMLTGAGEIVQNLENTGNALRVISLR